MGTGELASGLLIAGLYGLATAPIRAAQNVLSFLTKSPIGFLSSEERIQIEANENISRINAGGILNDVIIVTKFKYNLFTPVEVKVLWNSKENMLQVYEAGVFDKAFDRRAKKCEKLHSKYNASTINAIIAEEGCTKIRGSVGVEISDQYTPDIIVNAVNRVARTCVKIVEFA